MNVKNVLLNIAIFVKEQKLSNICYSCKYYLQTLIRNKRIICCDYSCEIGKKEKCVIFSEENICSSCNDGFILFKGNCFWIVWKK
jgi:hypothetical protein